MRLSDLFWGFVGIAVIVGALYSEYADTITGQLISAQTAVAPVLSGAWLIENWGMGVLLLAIVVFVVKRATNGARVETEDGKQADYPSYKFVKVEVIR